MDFLALDVAWKNLQAVFFEVTLGATLSTPVQLYITVAHVP